MDWPGEEECGLRGSGDAICAISPSSASRPPAIARQDAEGDGAAALVIGFAGGEKSSTQFGGWHGTRGPIHGACSDWPPHVTHTREKITLRSGPIFHGRAAGLASPRAKSTRSATTRIDVRERRSCSFALIKSAFLIPHLRVAMSHFFGEPYLGRWGYKVTIGIHSILRRLHAQTT